ncbi:MAG TPA: aldose 1-epimerase family protein [Pirellulaceae bacterium]|nr:aldose 1-epimerase family protein [Pirellulaceae bacterium]
MPVKTWTVVDPQQNSIKDFSITAADFGRATDGYHVTRKKLHGGLSDAVEALHIDNGTFAFTLLPTRGMGIWKAWLGKDEIGWQSPVRGPVHPQYVNLGEPSGLGWLDGFDELLVRCGLESNGAPEFDAETGRLKHPLHGRIANKPAHRCDVSIDSETGEIKVVGVVEETRFHFTKLRLTTTITTKIGQRGVTIRDEIENFSASPATAQMLYHINFGLPLLDGGSRVIAPVKQVVPRNPHAASGLKAWDSYSAELAGCEEQVYFLELLGDSAHATQVLLKNAHGTRGISLHFNTQQLPCFSLWKNTTAGADGYVTGLEPGTNFPNPRSFETKHDRVLKLAPGGKVTLDLTLEAHGNGEQITAAEQAISQLQGTVKPVIHGQPLPDWCA